MQVFLLIHRIASYELQLKVTIRNPFNLKPDPVSDIRVVTYALCSQLKDFLSL